MKKYLQKLKEERGLTLVELLAVIVILAIVATIAFVMIGNIIDNSKKDAFIADAQRMIDAAKLYEANGETIDASGVTAEKLHEEGLLDNILDPWKGTISEAKVTVSEDAQSKLKTYHVTLTNGTHTIDKDESLLKTETRDDVFE